MGGNRLAGKFTLLNRSVDNVVCELFVGLVGDLVVKDLTKEEVEYIWWFYDGRGEPRQYGEYLSRQGRFGNYRSVLYITSRE